MRGMGLLMMALVAPAMAAESGEEILSRVDRLRHPWPNFSVEMSVQDTKAEQRWRVLTRENGDTRLDGLSPKEKGRSVLMLGEQMWLLLPGSKRPLRVTPQQRLLGPAAGGEVARTRFREDYLVEHQTEEIREGQPCWRLELVARRPAASAQQVLLWVVKAGLLPLEADFRLASGKRARTVHFPKPVQVLGRLVLPGMRLTEANGAEVTVRFSEWSRSGVAEAAFELPGLDR